MKLSSKVDIEGGADGEMVMIVERRIDGHKLCWRGMMRGKWERAGSILHCLLMMCFLYYLDLLFVSFMNDQIVLVNVSLLWTHSLSPTYVRFSS